VQNFLKSRRFQDCVGLMHILDTLDRESSRTRVRGVFFLVFFFKFLFCFVRACCGAGRDFSGAHPGTS